MKLMLNSNSFISLGIFHAILDFRLLLLDQSIGKFKTSTIYPPPAPKFLVNYSNKRYLKRHEGRRMRQGSSTAHFIQPWQRLNYKREKETESGIYVSKMSRRQEGRQADLISEIRKGKVTDKLSDGLLKYW